MRCSLNLQLRSVHEKTQQPNRFDSPTDSGLRLMILSISEPQGRDGQYVAR